MARRAGRHRAQLLIEAAARPALQHFLAQWLPEIVKLRAPRSLRWSVDVDPLDID
jgi:primosomal protein N' (replication factor Y)